ncbi:MAG: hypothetical protein AAF609_27285 [Cyanobacteria bacterium P01_C01_bin.120]
MTSKEIFKNRNSVWPLTLLLLNICASILHYADNLLYFDAYPEPAWFSPFLTDSIWFVMTPLGMAGFWFYVQKKYRIAYFGLYSYVLLSQLTLSHYLISPIWELSLKMNMLILLESFMAIPLFVFLLWSQLILKESQYSSWDQTEI